MEIKINRIQIEDATGINSLSLQLGYPLSIPETENNIAEMIKLEDHEAFVARDKLQIVGWIHVFSTLRLESNPFVEIGGMVVHQGYRGKGIGRLLIWQAKDWAVKKNAGTLRVRCNTKRIEAHQFYEAMGFIVSKDQRVFVLSL